MKLAAWLRNERFLLLGGCALAALLVRLFVLSSGYVITPDGVIYAWLGRHLASGNFHEGLSAYQQPLYPLLVGFSSLLFPDLEFAGRMVSVLMGSLLVIPVYFLASSFYGKRVATLAAYMTIVFPVLVYYSTQLLTESTYALAFTATVLAGWHALKRSRPQLFFLTGVSLGTCYLIKPEAFGFFFLLCALVFIAKRYRQGVTWRAASRYALALSAGFLLLASPYIIYLRHQTGRWTISEKLNAHFLLLTPAEEAPRPPAPAVVPPPADVPSPVATDLQPPADLAPESRLTKFIVDATRSLRREYEILNLIFPPVFVLLTGVGLFRVKWSRARLAQELYLGSFLIVSLAGYALAVSDIRYFVSLLPLLICWLANGVVEFERWVIETSSQVRGAHDGGRKTGIMVRAICVVLTVALLLPLFVYLNRGDKWSDYFGQKMAGAWIKAHALSTPRVMSENPITSFYAGGEYVHLPDEEYPAVIASARQQKVGFLVVYARYQRNTRLSFLLQAQNTLPEIKPVYRYGTEGFQVVVYQLNDGAQLTSAASHGN
ncbi:MAG TPA: glycosyltransferase family 39 protein [Pyrinomonadaceae bacterium]|nr:glycosyltransferase family 39 protein [Pyrinomonadaceae bacterium]